ncbi:MAG: alpha/beta fold hydrolase [Christensenellales bacterium]
MFLRQRALVILGAGRPISPLIPTRAGPLQPPSLPMPVLVTWAEDDGIISHEEAQQTAQQLSHRDLLILPHCGHAPFWDCPDRLAAHLQSLIGFIS